MSRKSGSAPPPSGKTAPKRRLKEARLIAIIVLALPLVVVGGVIVTGLDLGFLLTIIATVALVLTVILTRRSIWRKKMLAQGMTEVKISEEEMVEGGANT